MGKPKMDEETEAKVNAHLAKAKRFEALAKQERDLAAAEVRRWRAKQEPAK